MKKLLFFTSVEEHQSLNKWTAEMVEETEESHLQWPERCRSELERETQSFNPFVLSSNIVVRLCVHEWERERPYIFSPVHLKSIFSLQENTWKHILAYRATSQSLRLSAWVGSLQLITISQQTWAECLWLALRQGSPADELCGWKSLEQLLKSRCGPAVRETQLFLFMCTTVWRTA